MTIAPESSTPVLVIEDEPEIQRFLRLSLESNGFAATVTENGRQGLRHAVSDRPEIVILDLGLPDMDGKEVIRQLREWSQMPILVLSARDREAEKIAALEAGADDYLTKPFGVGELLARLKVALRHARHVGGKEESAFARDGLTVDLARRTVTLDGAEAHLTPLEYQLLAILVKNAGKVITYSHLLREIWGKHTPENNNYLRIHMQHLRGKLGDNALHPRFLITEPGIGYRLREGE